METTSIRKVEDKPTTFPQFLERYRGQLATSLPRHLNADRMIRIALSCFRTNPKLSQCTPESVFASVLQAAQLGLEPGLAGQAYLVPFWNAKKSRLECQMIPGYRGLVSLARRSGEIATVVAHVVYARDHYAYELGSREHIEHRPCLDEDRGEPLFAYCVATYKSGDKQTEVMPWWQVMGIRDRTQSRNAKREIVGPWVDDIEEMARKTVIKRASKYWPMSVELSTAIGMDDAVEAGRAQQIDLKAAIKGDYQIMPGDEEETPAQTEAKVLKGSALARATLQARKKAEEDPAQVEQANLTAALDLIATAQTEDDLQLALDLARSLKSDDAQNQLSEAFDQAYKRLQGDGHASDH
jgi:recombination protein RecT